MTDSVFKLALDPYDRIARLCPALLALFPPAIVTTFVMHGIMTHYEYVISATIYFGITPLLCNLGRDRGKRIENELFVTWGGIPTTQMLMYQSSTLDQITLGRYRMILEKNIPDLKFMNHEEEMANAHDAAMICASAVKWLRTKSQSLGNQTIIFAENTHYGFRRNLLGIRPLAISLCSITFFSLEFYSQFANNGNMPPQHSWIQLSLILISLLWFFAVNSTFVKTSAFAYAEALLAGCDSIDSRVG